ncbi:MAG: single-stranded DNA-binding protein [Oscillospiraceae bacterium]|jgi:single-strand DNA-binding protein|nr:single-stranded DNA-binding protein [Oscillospiraceae bacterium]
MLNSSILMGRLTSNPELRHTSNDIAVTSFTLAVDRPYSSQGGEKITDFIDIVAWRKTAEFVCKYFFKGQLVAVEGSLQTRMYQDREGIKRKVFEIVASSVHFAEPKRNVTIDENNIQQNTNESLVTQSVESENLYSNGDTKDFQEIPIDDNLPF